MLRLNKYLKLVKKNYPEIDKESLQIFDDGFDYLVIVVKNKDAFRFPRKDEYAKGLEKEVAFVNELSGNSPVRVPQMKYLTDEKLGPYAVYGFISGTRFSRDLTKQFTYKELHEVQECWDSFCPVCIHFRLRELLDCKGVDLKR